RSYGHLRQLRRTHLDHLGVVERGAESAEVVVAIAVVILHPPAAGTGPRQLLRNPLHGNTGHVLNYFGQRISPRTVIGNVDIDLIGYQEQFEFAGDLDNTLQGLKRIDHTRWIVGIDDQDTDNIGIVFHLQVQVVKIRIPMVVGIQPVGERFITGVSRLRAGVRRVCRRRADTARRGGYVLGSFRDGITETVKKAYIVGCDLYAAERVGLLGQELPCRQYSLRRTVAVYLIGTREVGHDVFNPIGYDVILLYRVTDIFPGDGEAELPELLGFLNDLADFV